MGAIAQTQTSSCGIANPVVTIRVRSASQSAPILGKTVIPFLATQNAPFLVGIAVGDGQIVTSSLSPDDIRAGFIVSFAVHIRRGRDSFLAAHREVVATITKNDSRLGLALLSAQIPAGIAYPTLGETNPDSVIRWADIQENGFPEYKDYKSPDGLIGGTPIFDASAKYTLVGIVGRGKNKAAVAKFVPSDELRRFISR